MRYSAIVAIVLTSLSPSLAQACGGMFCSTAPPSGPSAGPQPVDQSAERIIFEVTPSGVVTHVQVQVAGTSESFAWVIPLTAVPQFGTTPIARFQLLESLTAPQLRYPAASGNCPSSAPSSGGMACGAQDEPTAASFSKSERPTYDNGVTHYSTQVFGAFVGDVIGGEDTAAIVKWLQDHDYNVTDNMVPAFQQYNKKGMVFAALKLQRDKGAADVEPVRMVIPGGEPCIPIRLTRVAAQPLMGIEAFILADRPYVPTNYSFGPVATSELSLFPDATTNYFAWVARKVGDLGGRHFVQERIWKLPTPADLTGAGHMTTFVSRYYTRMSPEDMTEDPIFMGVDPAGWTDTGAIIDLSSRPTLWGCVTADELARRTPGACAKTYCGPRGTCYEDGQGSYCRCGSGDTAQAISGPDGLPTFTCVPAENPLGVTDGSAGKDTVFDPCNAFNCGIGTCVLRGGFATCMCAGGDSATQVAGGVTCVSLPSGALGRGAGGGSESAILTDADDERPVRGPIGLATLSGLFVLAVAVARRRGAHST